MNFCRFIQKDVYKRQGLFLAPFLVKDWNEVKQMDYHRDNIETWHFSGIGVLVACLLYTSYCIYCQTSLKSLQFHFVYL